MHVGRFGRRNAVFFLEKGGKEKGTTPEEGAFRLGSFCAFMGRSRGEFHLKNTNARPKKNSPQGRAEQKKGIPTRTPAHFLPECSQGGHVTGVIKLTKEKTLLFTQSVRIA